VPILAISRDLAQIPAPTKEHGSQIRQRLKRSGQAYRRNAPKTGQRLPDPPPTRHPHHPDLTRRVSLSAVAGNEAGAQRANNAVTSVKEPSTQP
jgi:hypothetical protein